MSIIGYIWGGIKDGVAHAADKVGDWFHLDGDVGHGARNHPRDVMKVETILANSGEHDTDKTDGPTGFFSQGLGDSIRKFQRNKGLQIDGYMMPKGETITAMQQKMQPVLASWAIPTQEDVSAHHAERAAGGLGRLTQGSGFSHVRIPEKASFASSEENIQPLLRKAREQKGKEDVLANHFIDLTRQGKAGDIKRTLWELQERVPQQGQKLTGKMIERLTLDEQIDILNGKPRKVPRGVILNQVEARKSTPSIADAYDPEKDPYNLQIPANRKYVVQSNQDTYRPMLAHSKDFDPVYRTAFRDVMVQEGAGKKAENGVVFGVLPDTYREMKEKNRTSLTKPFKDLTPEDNLQVADEYFDYSLRHVGGRDAVKQLQNPKAAGALMDSLYRHGNSGGTKMIQRAINRIKPGTLTEDGGLGKTTFDAYVNLANDPKTAQQLQDALYNQRAKRKESHGELDRFDHFRQLGE